MGRELIISFKKIFFIAAIFSYPLIADYAMDRDFDELYLYENIINISLIILFLGFFNFLFDDKEIKHESAFFSLFVSLNFILMTFIMMIKVAIHFPDRQFLNLDNLSIFSFSCFALTILNYILSNQWILKNRIESEKSNVVKYVINVSIPEKIKKLYNQSSNLKKNIFWITIRFSTYIFISFILTQIITWIYPYELSTPNILTVFASVWGVITMFLETIYQKIIIEYEKIE